MNGATRNQECRILLNGAGSKLGLAPSDADHRRVLAVLRYLES